MPLTAQEVIKGQCYATSNNQHRRVIDIDGDTVTYESRGGNVSNEWNTKIKVNIDNFAQSVDRVISCE